MSWKSQKHSGAAKKLMNTAKLGIYRPKPADVEFLIIKNEKTGVSFEAPSLSQAKRGLE